MKRERERKKKNITSTQKRKNFETERQVRRGVLSSGNSLSAFVLRFRGINRVPEFHARQAADISESMAMTDLNSRENLFKLYVKLNRMKVSP